MASIQGRASIQSATPFLLSISNPTITGKSTISWDTQDTPSIISAIYGLFAAPDDAPGDGERSPKRRKIGHGTVAYVHPQADVDETSSIVLAKVSIDLVGIHVGICDSLLTCTKGCTFSKEQSRLDLQAIPLELQSFQGTTATSARNTQFQIGLWNPTNKSGLDIVAYAKSADIDPMIVPLRTAAALATTQNRQPKFRAAFCRCVLRPPTHPKFPQLDSYKLDVEIRWTLGMSVVEHPAVSSHYMNEDLKLLSTYMRDASAQTDNTWALLHFYDAVHIPPADLQVSPRIKHSLTDTALLPFQERTVDWLLRREGVAFSASGTLEPFVASSPPAFFRQTQDATGAPCYVSQLRGMVVADLNAARGDTLQTLRGGILAEEMGLGKTVELIALIVNHKREVLDGDVYDTYIGAQVKPSGATLIITPPSILEQWISEIHTHAPELKVCHYKGLKKDPAIATVDHLIQYDVVLTTYQVLSKEIHYAVPPPDRSTRHVQRTERRTSPLVGISWWRVCLDEAQMVESGVSQAAKVARIIPRCNAWAVSGTPLRKDVQDLRSLLIFLRCDAFANKSVWGRLNKASFKGIFSEIALRHNKDEVRDELRLPPQKRVVITVPFTAIEEQNYTELVRQMCNECMLSPEGIPQYESTRPITHPEVAERMREWLVRLRQTCLHAHVGRKNRKALGSKNGALRTVQEVLEIMIEQNDAHWKSEAREMILGQIKLGHIKAYAGNVEDRAQSALPYYQEALKDAQSFFVMLRKDLLTEQQKLGKITATNSSSSASLPVADEGEDQDKEGENMGRIPVLRKSLRSFLEVEHACKFFIATAYHQLKENEQLTKPESEDYHRLDKLEADWYEQAKIVRRELLQESKSKAQQQMAKVQSKKPFHRVPKIDDLPDTGGIEARKTLDTMDNIIDFLNAQAEQIQIWRMKIVDLLLTRLVDDDDDHETTGEEYDDSLKAQDKLYVYIMALRTLIADRNTAVHGLHDTLIEHELKAAEKQALRKNDAEGDRGHAPELLIEVVNMRSKLQATLQTGSLKGVISGIRSLITGLQWRVDGGDTRASAELSILQKHIAKIQAIATDQAKAITELEKEQETFRGTMNQRLEYYRQFQHISDTVAKYKEGLDETFDEREFNKCDKLTTKKKENVAGFKKKYTYLKYLRTENQNETEAKCIICLEDIEIGRLTSCGHSYCKECINTWWHSHRNCPKCKKKLNSSDFKNISFKLSEIKAQEETHPISRTQASIPASSTTSIYSDISSSTMKEIKMIDLNGSYGSKIDVIARHLIWIRNNDPGAKSILFSQFSDFLDVLREALKKWKIGVSSITDKDGIAKFKANPSLECLLLDAKSDSSGLTLVNATYVFLCEPLINPAIELQAINRVHRIGQQRPTTVFMYLISDTVEEAIYDISVARRLEHISSNSNSKPPESSTPALQERTLDAANSAELQSAPPKNLLRKKGDGEIVQQDDLWKCLFAKPRKPVGAWVHEDADRQREVRRDEGRVYSR
jgi:E3 ubiquitin-protein ligase SHPRH